MSQEKTKLVDKCFQHNRFMRLLPTGDQCIIAEAMHEEEDPVWPWISDSSGNCYMNINHIVNINHISPLSFLQIQYMQVH